MEISLGGYIRRYLYYYDHILNHFDSTYDWLDAAERWSHLLSLLLDVVESLFVVVRCHWRVYSWKKICEGFPLFRFLENYFGVE